MADLEQQNNTLLEQISKYKRMVINQTTELHHVNKRNKELQADLEQTQESLRMCRVQLDEANEERRDVKAVLARKDAEMEEIKSQMRSIIDELTEKTREFEAREVQAMNLVEELKMRIGGLVKQLKDGEKYQQELLNQITRQTEEIERLKARLRCDSRFQQYVAIKREVSGLREKNVSLSQKVHEVEAQQLPVITSRGDVTTIGARGTSARTSRRRVKSAHVRRVTRSPIQTAMGATVD